MKFSAYHANHGLSGTLRLTQTGETIHFEFPKGQNRLPVIVNAGGHRIETFLLIEPIESAEGDELDMRIRLEAPADAQLDAGRTPHAVAVPAKEKVVGSDGFPMEGNSMRVGPPPIVRHRVVDGLPGAQEPVKRPAPKPSREQAEKTVAGLEKSLNDPHAGTSAASTSGDAKD